MTYDETTQFINSAIRYKTLANSISTANSADTLQAVLDFANDNSGGGGTIPNLQQVTDSGSVTTNFIQSSLGFIALNATDEIFMGEVPDGSVVRFSNSATGAGAELGCNVATPGVGTSSLGLSDGAGRSISIVAGAGSISNLFSYGSFAGGPTPAWISSAGFVYPEYTDAEIDTYALEDFTVPLVIWSVTHSELQKLNVATKLFEPLFTGSGGGGTTYNANNGLTLGVGNIFELGGSLTKNTQIIAGAFNLDITGTGHVSGTISINRTSTAANIALKITSAGNNVPAVFGSSTGASGTGVTGTSSTTDGVGVSGTNASSGIGIEALSSTGLPLNVNRNTGTTGIDTIVKIAKGGTAQAVIGSGVAIEFFMATTTSSKSVSKIVTKWTDPNDLTRRSEMSFVVQDGGTANTLLSLVGNGRIRFDKSLPNYADDAAATADAVLLQNTLYRVGNEVRIKL